MTPDQLVLASLAYVAIMFAVAFAADRAAARGRAVRWLDHPAVYTLSLSVYCSAWTFYGAVGYAVRSGLEFLTIYLGPTIVFCGAWWGLRRLVAVARLHHVTSVADLISARFGKSNALAALVTLLALVASTPYIALQLQSVSLSFAALTGSAVAASDTALWVAAGLALFTILFGTRNLAADERHHGVVTAIALEAVVKLLAFLALGVFTVWGLADGPGDILDRLRVMADDPAIAPGWLPRADRWTALIVVAGGAVVALPRMFQVLVVEAPDEDRLRVAGWAFPAYLFAMSLFVLPIAVMGRALLPDGANPDLYVLTLPAAMGRDDLALVAFLGGFAAATSMVVMACIALATMISNHWLVPGWMALRRRRAGAGRPPAEADDLRGFVLSARRLAILAVMAASWAYHHASGGSAALAAMGLVAFTGMAQVLPAMLGGLLWRGANGRGAMAGLGLGAAAWLALIFLPSIGIGAAPRWPAGVDPFAAAVFVSLGLNGLGFLAVSLAGFPDPVERLQGLSFVHAVEPDRPAAIAGPGRAEPLLALARRVLGAEPALRFFRAEATAQGKAGYLPDLTPRFLMRLERRLAGSLGAATAHAMIGRVAGGAALSVADLMAVAGEASRAKAETRRLETAGAELERTARALREANEKLTALSVQKDAFLGQISHELRTPMTSVRAFSEFLQDPALPEAERLRFAAIIHAEAGRLTRLLDDLLDLSVLESGRATLAVSVVNLHDVIERAVTAASATRPDRAFTVDRDLPAEHMPLITDADRLLQVLINVISNARKYCDAERPALTIRALRRAGAGPQIDVIDNGSGIPADRQGLIFEKFARLNDPARAGGAGLGLAICREIMAALGGTIDYLPGQGGAAFRLTLPARPPVHGTRDGAMPGPVSAGT